MGDCSPSAEDLCGVNPNDIFGGSGGVVPRDVLFNDGRRRSSSKSLRGELLVRQLACSG